MTRISGARPPEPPAVTHLIEVEDPTTGDSRMFSGAVINHVVDEATAWLDSRSGLAEPTSDREVAWDII